jgi:hypothetical protein
VPSISDRVPSVTRARTLRTEVGPVKFALSPAVRFSFAKL